MASELELDALTSESLGARLRELRTGAGFSLRAGFDGQAKLEGSVEGAPVHLEVAVVEGATRTQTVVGSYQGPLPLLLVLSGVLLFFT